MGANSPDNNLRYKVESNKYILDLCELTVLILKIRGHKFGYFFAGKDEFLSS